MVKLDMNARMNLSNVATVLFIASSILLISSTKVEAGDKGDDIILTKGKLIMRGGKGKGNLILDTGKSHEGHGEHMMSMMPMVGHHFNPYSFYPMHHEQHHHQPAMIHPIYLEDHSAMHQHQQQHHHMPEHHHQQQHHEYHHEEPHHQHHEVQYHHEQPHHQEGHQEVQHMEPMGHHYEHEGHGEEEGHHHYGGYESNPMVSSMMMHGSGAQPTYQQLATMQAYQHPVYEQQVQSYANPEQLQQQLQAHQQQQQQIQQQQQNQQQKLQNTQQQVAASEQQNKKTSLLSHSANNPLVAMIKPLFKRHQKKPAAT